jgi:hypothetical protein
MFPAFFSQAVFLVLAGWFVRDGAFDDAVR